MNWWFGGGALGPVGLGVVKFFQVLAILGFQFEIDGQGEGCPFRFHYWWPCFGFTLRSTPHTEARKQYNMDPKNDAFHEESPFQGVHHFQVQTVSFQGFFSVRTDTSNNSDHCYAKDVAEALYANFALQKTAHTIPLDPRMSLPDGRSSHRHHRLL